MVLRQLPPVVRGITSGHISYSYFILMTYHLYIVSSKVRLFADDCLIYRNIKNKEDQIALQKNLNLLENWGNTWSMRITLPSEILCECHGHATLNFSTTH